MNNLTETVRDLLKRHQAGEIKLPYGEYIKLAAAVIEADNELNARQACKVISINGEIT